MRLWLCVIEAGKLTATASAGQQGPEMNDRSLVPKGKLIQPYPVPVIRFFHLISFDSGLTLPVKWAPHLEGFIGNSADMQLFRILNPGPPDISACDPPR
jgi:hypothetical protein